MNVSMHNPEATSHFISRRSDETPFAVQHLQEANSGASMSAFFDSPGELEALAAHLLTLAQMLREAKNAE